MRIKLHLSLRSIDSIQYFWSVQSIIWIYSALSFSIQFTLPFDEKCLNRLWYVRARCLVSIFICNIVDRVGDPIDFPTVASVHDDCLVIGSNVSQFTVLFASLSITGFVSVWACQLLEISSKLFISVDNKQLGTEFNADTPSNTYTKLYGPTPMLSFSNLKICAGSDSGSIEFWRGAAAATATNRANTMKVFILMLMNLNFSVAEHKNFLWMQQIN